MFSSLILVFLLKSVVGFGSVLAVGESSGAVVGAFVVHLGDGAVVPADVAGSATLREVSTRCNITYGSSVVAAIGVRGNSPRVDRIDRLSTCPIPWDAGSRASTVHTVSRDSP